MNMDTICDTWQSLSMTDHFLCSRNHINVVVAGKQPVPQWLTRKSTNVTVFTSTAWVAALSSGSSPRTQS